MRTELTGVGEEVLMLQRSECTFADVAHGGPGSAAEEVALQPAEMGLGDACCVEHGEHLLAALSPMPRTDDRHIRLGSTT